MDKTILIIGGAFQNKLRFALERYGLSADDVGENRRIWDNFQEYFKNNMDDDGLLAKCMGRIIICDEVGCGIIPLEKSDRIYREALGRFLCRLAEVCDSVIRVSCGIGTVIKGE